QRTWHPADVCVGDLQWTKELRGRHAEVTRRIVWRHAALVAEVELASPPIQPSGRRGGNRLIQPPRRRAARQAHPEPAGPSQRLAAEPEKHVCRFPGQLLGIIQDSYLGCNAHIRPAYMTRRRGGAGDRAFETSVARFRILT